MGAGKSHWWLESSSGGRVAVGRGGLYLGRDPSCDLVLEHPRASRQQALVVLAADGPVLVELGRNRNVVNGEVVSGSTALGDGDEIQVPGARYKLRASAAEAFAPQGAWVLLWKGGAYGLREGVQAVGPVGAAVELPGWQGPPILLSLDSESISSQAQQRPVLRLSEDDGDGAVEVQRSTAIAAGGGEATLDFREIPETTTAGEGPSDPAFVTLEFLARGGHLAVDVNGEMRRVWLSDLRCELVGFLLRPPSPYRVGEFVSDEVVGAHLWRGKSVDRAHMNNIIYRVRRDLESVGIDARTFVERSPGGGGTRIRVGPNTRVDIR